MPAYALTICLGAFLLFQVQPLIGKFILPWFGGGPGVWTTCLLFFQGLLVGGYAYAHAATRWLRPRGQAVLHLAWLAVAVAWLPITPADTWKPHGAGDPVWRILGLLTACLGVPYFVLSATGPLLQHWFARAHPGATPYRLYALSNAGSLLALVSYPFLFEPNLTLKAQAALWGWGMAGYALCCGWCAARFWRAESRVSAATLPSHADTATPPPTLGQRLLWLALPACASALLLAVTNKLCLDVAVIPFLWVLPLALYLLSFVVCFDSPRWYRRVPVTVALAGALTAVCWVMDRGTHLSLKAQVTAYAGGLFVCCLAGHGELYRLRPAPRHLTGFYLMLATGGALGGVFVGVLAPVLFTDYHELPVAMFGCALLVSVALLRDRATLSPAGWRWLGAILAMLAAVGLHWLAGWTRRQFGWLPSGMVLGARVGIWLLLLAPLAWLLRGEPADQGRRWRRLAGVCLALGVLLLGGVLWRQARDVGGHRVERVRNFYGVLTVLEYDRDELDLHYYLLQHGSTTHGLQFTSPDLARRPTTYYSAGSGIDLALRTLAAGQRRIGVVGLGVGTIAAHAVAGDTLRFYEINPEVRALATSRFTYLSRCAADVEVILGDARLTLERAACEQFDVLALDAFSSDSIPVHLLTREAFEIYLRHLKPAGILAIHISNHYLNLQPVVAKLACHFGCQMALVDYSEPIAPAYEEGEEDEWWRYSSEWLLLSRDGSALNSSAIQSAASPVKTNVSAIPLWTDDCASLFRILK